MTMHQWDVVSVLRVVRGKGGFWEVRTARFDAPLFHFRTRRDAKSYAEDIAQAQPGISVEVCAEDEGLRGAGDTRGRLPRVVTDPRRPFAAAGS